MNGKDRFLEKNYPIVVSLFFSCYLLIGVMVFRDYGAGLDMYHARITGGLSLSYALGSDELLKQVIKYNGPAFEIFLIGVERALGIGNNLVELVNMRHLTTFIFFVGGMFVFYHICLNRFKSWKWALLGTAFLGLHPRIFAHAFFNSKDIPFLVAMTLSTLTCIWFIKKRSLKAALIHGALCGFAIAIRAMGIIVPVITCICVFFDKFCVQKDNRERGNDILTVLTYTFSVLGFTILFWPLLWRNGPAHFIEALRWMATVGLNIKTLYFGELIKVSDLPWHYNLVMIAITTPIVYLAIFLVGLVILTAQIMKDPVGHFKSKPEDFIFLASFFIPLAATIIRKAGSYDEWRHMFFIYPLFVIIGLMGLRSVWARLSVGIWVLPRHILRTGIIVSIVLGLGKTIFDMITLHPYQNVYFNRLAGNDLKKAKMQFDVDYWAVSYKEALEYILKHDTRSRINIHSVTKGGLLHGTILNSSVGDRFTFVEDINEADYFLTNYRWHPEDYNYENEFFSIERNGAKITTVFRLRSSHESVTNPASAVSAAHYTRFVQ